MQRRTVHLLVAAVAASVISSVWVVASFATRCWPLLAAAGANWLVGVALGYASLRCESSHGAR